MTTSGGHDPAGNRTVATAYCGKVGLRQARDLDLDPLHDIFVRLTSPDDLADKPIELTYLTADLTRFGLVRGPIPYHALMVASGLVRVRLVLRLGDPTGVTAESVSALVRSMQWAANEARDEAAGRGDLAPAPIELHVLTGREPGPNGHRGRAVMDTLAALRARLVGNTGVSIYPVVRTYRSDVADRLSAFISHDPVKVTWAAPAVLDRLVDRATERGDHAAAALLTGFAGRYTLLRQHFDMLHDGIDGGPHDADIWIARSPGRAARLTGALRRFFAATTRALEARRRKHPG